MSRRSSASSVKSVARKRYGGYESADLHVSEAMMRGAKAIAGDTYRLEMLLTDEFTLQACEYTGIAPQELIARPFEDFRLEVGRARAVPREVQKKRYNHAEARRLWKLAAVLAERDKRMERAAEEAKAQLKRDGKLVEAYTAMMEREGEILKREAVAAEKVAKAIIKENKLLVRRREDFETTNKVVKERHARQKEVVKAMRAAQKARAREKEAEAQAMVAQQRELVAMDIASRADAVEKKQARLAAFEVAKEAELAELREANRREEMRREEVRHRVKAQDGLYRQYVAATMTKKMSKTQSVQAMRDEAVAARKEDRRIMYQTKKENVERIKQVRLLKKRQDEAKLRAVEERLEHMKMVREAVEEERQLKKKADLIYMHSMRDKVSFERKKLPGPGEYDAPPASLPDGGQWGTVTVKSALDLEIERSAAVPGPGKYDVSKGVRTDKGVLWGDFVHKTHIETVMEAAAKRPGPADYDTRPRNTGPVTQFQESESSSFLDPMLKLAADTPGPGHYSKPPAKTVRPKLKAIERQMKAKAKELGVATISSPLHNGTVRGRKRPPIPGVS